MQYLVDINVLTAYYTELIKIWIRQNLEILHV